MKNVLILGNAKKQKEKMEVSTVLSQLNNVYELFIEQALESATARKGIETLKQMMAEKD